MPLDSANCRPARLDAGGVHGYVLLDTLFSGILYFFYVFVGFFVFFFLRGPLNAMDVPPRLAPDKSH